MCFHSLAARGSQGCIWSACPVAVLSMLHMLLCLLQNSWLKTSQPRLTHFQRNIFIRSVMLSSSLFCYVNLGILWLGSIFLEQPSLLSPPPSIQWTRSPCSAWGIVLVINSGIQLGEWDQQLSSDWGTISFQTWFLIVKSRGFQYRDCLGSSLKCRFKANGARMGVRWGPGTDILTSSCDALNGENRCFRRQGFCGHKKEAGSHILNV